MSNIKVAIIEDEPLARNELKKTLVSLDSNIEVVAELPSVQDSVNWFKSSPEVDLVFTDIQLTDGHSFEIFPQVEINVPIIFVTAFDEFAIRAFELNSIDYLLKPYDEIALERALDKFKKMSSMFQSTESIDLSELKQLITGSNPNGYKKHLLAKIGDEYRRIGCEDIAYFEAEGNTVFLTTREKKRLIIEYSLDELSSYIDPQEFYRINRQILINHTAIKKIHKYFNHRLKLQVYPEANQDVLVSRARVNGFLEWLDN